MPVSTRAAHKLLRFRWMPESCSLPKCLHPLISIAHFTRKRWDLRTIIMSSMERNHLRLAVTVGDKGEREFAKP